MIKTLTLNPALDKTIIVESFRLNQLNRIKKVHKDAGGKGINVSKMVDSVNNTFTDLNEVGAHISEANIEELKDSLFADLKANDILVLTGSVPAGVEKDIYFKLIKAARKRGVKTILDADGPLFREGIKAAPTLIKPNEHELSLHFKEEFKDLKTMIRKAESLLDTGIEMIMFSLGKEGAVFITAAACSSATLIREGTEMGSKSDVARLNKDIKLKKL